MIIATNHQKIILNPSNPERVLTLIPTAKQFTLRGRQLIAVPHRPDETKVLRNLGLEVPHPIKYYYAWPGRYKPFHAQLETAAFLASHRRAYCLNGMGSGKTISTLWAYDYCREQGVMSKLLVVSPLSTLERAWGDEIFRNFPHLNFAVLHGDRRKRLKLLEQDADIYIINHDGIKVVVDALKDRPDIDQVVPDELAAFRNAGTDRWKALNEICNKQAPRGVWGLTGTPTPNAPTDAWAQCRLIAPHNVPKYYGQFRDSVMKQLTQYKWIPRASALDTVRQVMQPAIRFSLDDCTDLPEQVFQERQVDLSPEQKKLYKEMLSKLHAEYLGGEITAVNEAVKASKLVQIACGVAYSNDGSQVIVPADARIEVVKELIEEAEGKVIVFVPFTGALNEVANKLGLWLDRPGWTRDRLLSNGRHGDEVAVVHGATGKNDRDEIFRAFQHDTRLRVLVANPGTMAHGLTLTAASVIIWFAPPTSNEIYEQACARVRRPGQKRTTVIAHISGTSVEDRMYARLRDKQSMQSLLLDLIKEERQIA